MKITDYKVKPEYHKNPEWFQQRNKDLMKDRKSGMSWAELMRKYGLSETRLRGLVLRLEKGGQ